MPPPETAEEIDALTPLSESQKLSKFFQDRSIEELAEKAGDLEAFWQLVLEHFEKKSAAADSILKQMPGYVREVIPNVDRLNPRELIYYYNVTRTLARACDQYIPGGKVKTAVHFFAAGGANLEKEKEWQDYSVVPIKIIEIKADHFSVLKEPAVVVLCGYIDEAVSAWRVME
jgi:thioesterase domain-containing protein